MSAEEVITITPVQWAEELAVAWDKGWEAAWTPMSMRGLNDGPNPYRGDA